jgi:hypothetical protein
MHHFSQRKHSFLWIALVVFGFLAIATNRHVLVGRIPFSADLINYFPPWEAAHIKPASSPHAEIGDSVTLFYPWRFLQTASMRRGELPLWNPLILGGTPFLAEAQSALFYPPNLLHLFFSMPTAWMLKVLLNVMLAGFFTALFVRDIGGSRLGAIAAGLIFACCGFMTAWQLFSSLADTTIWLPFAFFAVYRLCRFPSVSLMAMTATAFALVVLAGHPETAIHVVLAAASFAVWQCFAAGWQDRTVTRRLIWFAAASLLAIGLASVQIIPTLEWIGHLSRPVVIHWPAQPLRQILAFISRDLKLDPNSAGLPIPESAAYVAPLALLLAPLALLYRGRREPLYFLLLIIASMQLAFGTGPVRWVIERTPLLEGIKNGRALLLVDFSLAVLAGLGITLLGEALDRMTFRKYAWILPASLFVLIASATWLLSSETQQPVKWYRGPGSTAVFLAIGFILIMARLWNGISARHFSIFALLVLSADMVTFRSGVVPFVPRREIFPDVPVFQFLNSKNPAEYRIAVLDGTSSSNFEMMYGVPEVGGYDLSLKLAKDYLNDFGLTQLDAVTLTAEQVVKVKDRRLDLMNVRYLMTNTANHSDGILAARPDRFSLVFSEGMVRVFENRHALERVRFLPAGPGTVEVIANPEGQLARVKDPAFDAGGSVILSAMPEGWSRSADIESNTSGSDTVASISSSVNQSSFKVSNRQPGLLVVSQIFYPGWRATVDGEPAPVLQADYAIVAIPLKGGSHVVQLVFDPMSFRVGLMITSFACLLLACLLMFRAAAASRKAPIPL